MSDLSDSAIDLCEFAWGIIANAGDGNWSKESVEWQQAAARWRDQYHTLLSAKTILKILDPNSNEISSSG